MENYRPVEAVCRYAAICTLSVVVAVCIVFALRRHAVWSVEAKEDARHRAAVRQLLGR
jgi:membrane protein YdbS with pleckstrin-like domain